MRRKVTSRTSRARGIRSATAREARARNYRSDIATGVSSREPSRAVPRQNLARSRAMLIDLIRRQRDQSRTRGAQAAPQPYERNLSVWRFPGQDDRVVA